jgi:hypothetical protein
MEAAFGKTLLIQGSACSAILDRNIASAQLESPTIKVKHKSICPRLNCGVDPDTRGRGGHADGRTPARAGSTRTKRACGPSEATVGNPIASYWHLFDMLLKGFCSVT